LDLFRISDFELRISAERFRISDFELRISDAGFACYRCHRIRSFSRIDAKNSWNELVSYISGGLMYGREVEMPANFGLPTTRKRVYRPRLVKPRSQGERAPSRPTLVSEGVMA
jgi:hypothetical protein